MNFFILHPFAFILRLHLSERKPFLIRIDPAVLEAIQRWADDDLRSLNGQIEWILRWALEEAHRARPKESAQKSGKAARENVRKLN